MPLSMFEKLEKESVHALLEQLKIAINFLHTTTTLGKTHIGINDFMAAYKIQRGELENVIPPELKIVHIVQLYETVEERVEHIEVEKINKHY